MIQYPEEFLDEEADDGTMVGSKEALERALVGHRIVSAERGPVSRNGFGGPLQGLILTLDNGYKVEVTGNGDCCAYTEVESFLLNPELVDHAILGVGTTDQYQTWHIYADMGDVLKLDVAWSPGNPFYYGYGFTVQVKPV